MAIEGGTSGAGVDDQFWQTDCLNPQILREPPQPLSIVRVKNDTPAQGVMMTRPLCVFPKIPRYAGSGDPNVADSFECVPDRVRDNPMPAPEYLAPNFSEAPFEYRFGNPG
jgi:hypothetical protein